MTREQLDTLPAFLKPPASETTHHHLRPVLPQ